MLLREWRSFDADTFRGFNSVESIPLKPAATNLVSAVVTSNAFEL
jgi:hypothetical protein